VRGEGFGRGTPALGIHGMDLDFRRDFRGDEENYLDF